MTKRNEDLAPFLKDITDLTFSPGEKLEDQIFDEFEKLEALCQAMVLIETTQDASSSFIRSRSHYSRVLGDQVAKTRSLLERYFG